MTSAAPTAQSHVIASIPTANGQYNHETIGGGLVTMQKMWEIFDLISRRSVPALSVRSSAPLVYLELGATRPDARCIALEDSRTVRNPSISETYFETWLLYQSP
ncbi:hypothetical protein WAI453_005991 [Rhynchosporium graminicola]